MNSAILTKIIKPAYVKLLKWALVFFLLIIAQISVLNFFSLEFRPNTVVKPDIVLIFLFFFGIRYSQLTSTLTGFAAGFFLDALGGGMLGLHALTKTVAGFLMGYVPRTHKIHKIVQFCLLFFTISIIHDMLYNAIYIINTELGFWRLLFVHSLLSTIYSVFIGSIIYYWLKR